MIDWKYHKFVILVGFVEVVHKVTVQHSLDHSGDKWSPNNVLPTENPELKHELPVQDVESTIKAQKQHVMSCDILNVS